MSAKKPRKNPYVDEKAKKVRVQLSIEKRQVEWLQRRNAFGVSLSPSKILRDAINQLMEREKKLMGDK